jgi:aminoglycoside phosphotransferase family enzyme
MSAHAPDSPPLPASVPLEAKVALLRRPDAYPEVPTRVDTVETHMSWVFLAGDFVYKLKKPVRYDFLDFSTPEARRRDCEEEVRLNRRLAPDVYLGVVPLSLAPDGALRLAGQGRPVDWLVSMRRLPERLMLDRAIRAGTASAGDVRRAIAALASFYLCCEPVAMDAAEYRQRFAQGVRTAHRELSAPDYRLSASRTQAVAESQLAFLERHAAVFDRRVRDRRILEGHGDLRPEHVCLSEPPVFIDCLEFNREWRLVDPADELAYLALECEHAGATALGAVALAAYREQTGDIAPERLVHFYKSYRATVRAKLAAWHLQDHLDEAARLKWLDDARRYLALAQRYADSLAVTDEA